MRHIYNCELINNKQKPRLDYDKLYTENIAEQIEDFRKFDILLLRDTQKKRIVGFCNIIEGDLINKIFFNIYD